MAVAIEEAREAVQHPTAPTTLDGTGLSVDLVTQLVTKALNLAGELTGLEIASRLGLTFSAVEPVIEDLMRQHHCEIAGGMMTGRASYRYRITDAGRARAMLFMQNNAYVGVAPVPIGQYRAYMAEYAKTDTRKATRGHIHQAFSHLVIGDRVLDQLGPAINARHSMFVYGPPGNGKTVISQAIRDVLGGEIAIPHALEVEGSIIRIFDPTLHEELGFPESGPGLDAGTQVDRRWARCRRPMVMVGGELRLSSLDLSDPRGSGFYRAPVQTVANGGVLVIDDFGRQQCAPRELLNRWIVPLESRVDFLTLATGQKLELPFMTLVVFATNLDPSELVDEAFLRRIHYKIRTESPTAAEFHKIFEDVCRAERVAFDPSHVAFLFDEWYRTRNIPLRGCHPRDLIHQALSLAEYLSAPRALTPELLDAACRGYFVHDAPTDAKL